MLRFWRLSIFFVALIIPHLAKAKDPDVVIIGAGIAGLSAAIIAAENNAMVEVVDIAATFGGHAVMAEGGVSIVGTQLQSDNGVIDTPDIAFNDFTTWGEDANEDWVRYYASNSNRDVYEWLTHLGVQFDRVSRPQGNSVRRFHRTIGQGTGLVTPIFQACLKKSNISFKWQHRATKLHRGTSGAIESIEIEDLKSHQKTLIKTRAVIVATGGFQSNLEKIKEVWSKNLQYPQTILAGSGENSVGSGLDLAQAIGAKVFNMDHQWNYPSGLLDPRFPGTNRGIYVGVSNYIWVNNDAKRFVDEKASVKVKFPAVLKQNPPSFWMIFDDHSKDDFWVSGAGWGKEKIKKLILSNPNLIKSAPTVKELASVIVLNPEKLQDAVTSYNKEIESNIEHKPITVPPFYAAQLFPLARKSMGGLKVDLQCRVLDTDDTPIPGLYAAGEVAGFGGINGKAALEGTFLGPAVAMGRIAGQEASRK